MGEQPYQPSQDIPLPTDRAELEAFARAWIDTAAMHARNEEYWRQRAEIAEKELEVLGGYSAFLNSCAKSGEQPETYEWYKAKRSETS